MLEVTSHSSTLPATTATMIPSLARSAADFAAASRSEATRKAYRSDWSQFVDWSRQADADSLPATPATVAAYLAGLAGTHKPASISRKLAAIAAAHKLADFPSPTGSEAVRLTFAGIKRTLGTHQRQARPILTEDLRKIVAQLPDDLAGLRDQALLLVGFSAALRRSELTSIAVNDLDFTDAGLILHIPRSKTDQEGEGRDVGVPYGSSPDTCPVMALRAWLEAAEITEGPIFRKVDRHGHIGSSALTPQAVALVVKRSVEAVGFDPDAFAGHSLRAGLATSAAQNGASDTVIMSQTGHKSSAMVRKYIRRGNLFRANAASAAGL